MIKDTSGRFDFNSLRLLFSDVCFWCATTYEHVQVNALKLGFIQEIGTWSLVMMFWVRFLFKEPMDFASIVLKGCIETQNWLIIIWRAVV